ncbi:MAG: efflux RND transporter permease subunit [Myxococcales bacterium]
MFSVFFIERPIFAAVLSIVIVLAGGLAFQGLPISQYPQISPPTVQVTATFPGANAQVVEQSVTTPIEEQVNGAEGMLYMSSTSANDGTMSLAITFDISRDPDLAAVDVQNRVALAQRQLPDAVIRQGVTVRRASTNIVLLASLISPSNAYDAIFLSNYASINLVDALARVPGVGQVTVIGARDYGMRLWLDPDKLAHLGLTASDVISAVNAQNVQAPAGQVGQPPSPAGQQFQYTVQVKGRLASTEEFADIIVHANPDGSVVHVRDVARVELAAQTYTQATRLSRQQAVSIAIYQLPSANALDVARGVRAALKDLAAAFPAGVEYRIPLDTTAFVTTSIEEVAITLLIALALVFVVVYVFLQSWRATLIPAVAVPVSLVGTGAAFAALGFSINTLTLFGLVLAVGLVVDDAIVVVEAVQLHIDEQGMSPKDAALAAMREVSGPVVAVALVLTAVFLPVAFLGGITGQLYKQFALTLAVSVIISAFEALTLSPALCALLLRRTEARRPGPLLWFFGGFNRIFGRITESYAGSVRTLVGRKVIVFVAFAVLCVGSYLFSRALPTGFVPAEDQGYYMMTIQLPNAASLERTQATLKKVEDIVLDTPGVAYVIAIAGQNILSGSTSSNMGTAFVILKPWDERDTPETSVNGVMASTQRKFAQIPEALIMAFNPPAGPGLGRTGGFQFELEDRSGQSLDALVSQANKVLAEAGKQPEIAGAFTSFRADVPQIGLEVDRSKVITLGVPLPDVFTALTTYLGGVYVNDFNLFGRTYRVMVQAEPQFRSDPQSISRFYVRASGGDMVPLSTLTTQRMIQGPDVITRFNLHRNVEINGAASAGRSSGDAIRAMERIGASLPAGFGFEWTGMSYQEVTTRGQAGVILALAIVFVFLVLAAQYESWTVPFAVILAVPLGVFGAYLAQWMRGLDNNVYAQIGLVMLVGLAAKNAILIVEYAKVRYEQGLSLGDAAVEGARIRFRPILMTSFAFIFGVLPLVVATGAGSAARHALGTSVFGGMVAATILGVLFIPIFFAGIEQITERRSRRTRTSEAVQEQHA